MMNEQAEALRLQVEILLHRAKFDEIIQLCELKTTDPISDIVIIALLGLNDAYYARGEITKARQNVETALALAREQGSPKALAEALCSLAFLNVFARRYDAETTSLAQEALCLAEEHHYPRAIVLANRALGSITLFSGSKAAARGYYDKALTTAQHAKDRELEADAWGSLSYYFYWARNLRKAEKCGKSALTIHSETGNDLDRSIILCNMSHLYFTHPRDFRTYDKAVSIAQEGLLLTRELGYRFGEMSALLSLGACYRIALRFDDAKDIFQQALILAQDFGDKIGMQAVLSNLADVHYGLRDFDRALFFLNEMLAFADSSEYSIWEIYAHYTIGNVYFKQRRFAEAIAYWRLGLTFEKQLNSRKPRYYFNLFFFYLFASYCQIQMLFRGKPKAAV